MSAATLEAVKDALTQPTFGVLTFNTGDPCEMFKVRFRNTVASGRNVAFSIDDVGELRNLELLDRQKRPATAENPTQVLEKVLQLVQTAPTMPHHAADLELGLYAYWSPVRYETDELSAQQMQQAFTRFKELVCEMPDKHKYMMACELEACRACLSAKRLPDCPPLELPSNLITEEWATKLRDWIVYTFQIDIPTVSQSYILELMVSLIAEGAHYPTMPTAEKPRFGIDWDVVGLLKTLLSKFRKK